MNLLHMFSKTEAKLKDINLIISLGHGTLAEIKDLKTEKEYLLDVLALLFKELER